MPFRARGPKRVRTRHRQRWRHGNGVESAYGPDTTGCRAPAAPRTSARVGEGPRCGSREQARSVTKPHLRIVLALVTASALVSVAPVSAAISEPEHSTWASNAARSANLRFAWEWRFPLPGAGAASLDPPTWTRRKPVCPLVDLTSPRNPAGIPGRAGDGYNVYYLAIVERREIQCPRARKLARRHWIRGTAPR